VAGDSAALRDFVLHSSWLKIKRRKGFSQKAKVEALRYVSENMNVVVMPSDTPSDFPAAPPAREEIVAQPDPWYGDGTPPPDPWADPEGISQGPGPGSADM